MDCCADVGAEVDHDEGKVTHKGRTSWVRTYPIPVEPADLQDRMRGEAAQAWKERFERLRPKGGSLIVRADRTEPSKNIVRGFEAFGLLLDDRPDLARRTRFVACLYPSRQSMREYRRYSDEAREAARSVNERHPGSIELFLEDDFDRTVAVLSEYDVLLVNPIMDGMNLVSKEGPCLNERNGVLVLSKGAGSFEELGELAIPIENPLDVAATAAALSTAIDLDAGERARRAIALRIKVVGRKPGDWIAPQLDDLSSIRETGRPVSSYV